jgi:predicted RNA-binding Zn ribbon-like protein
MRASQKSVACGQLEGSSTPHTAACSLHDARLALHARDDRLFVCEKEGWTLATECATSAARVWCRMGLGGMQPCAAARHIPLRARRYGSGGGGQVAMLTRPRRAAFG